MRCRWSSVTRSISTKVKNAELQRLQEELSKDPEEINAEHEYWEQMEQGGILPDSLRTGERNDFRLGKSGPPAQLVALTTILTHFSLRAGKQHGEVGL